ncbi:MAG: hypothetical protein LUG26_01180 [Ruminococcus sp.]|nr:hypothetical protein [Ruminococcus sp.]
MSWRNKLLIGISRGYNRISVSNGAATALSSPHPAAAVSMENINALATIFL